MPTEAEPDDPCSLHRTTLKLAWRPSSARTSRTRKTTRRTGGSSMSRPTYAEVLHSSLRALARRRRAARVRAPRRGVATGVRGEDAPPAVADVPEERAAFERPARRSSAAPPRRRSSSRRCPPTSRRRCARARARRAARVARARALSPTALGRRPAEVGGAAAGGAKSGGRSTRTAARCRRRRATRGTR